MFISPTGIIYSGKRGTSIRSSGMLNGILSLLYPDPGIVLNSMKIQPWFIYLGGSANITNLVPPTIGGVVRGQTLSIVESGSPPSFNTGSCFFGSANDDSVKFPGTYPGGHYETASDSVYQITTEDVFIEYLLNLEAQDATDDWIMTKNQLAATKGIFVVSNGGNMRCRISDGTNFQNAYAPTMPAYSWVFGHIVINRNEASANGMKHFCNAQAGTGADPSAVGSLTNTGLFRLGRWLEGGTTRYCRTRLAYIMGCFANNWIAAGAGGMTEAANLITQRFTILKGLLPIFAAGNKTPEVV